jgi:hypothetical protein
MVTSSLFKVNFPSLSLRSRMLIIFQAVSGQLERDAQIKDLVDAMEDVYSFVDAVDIREKVKILEDTIITILQQTVECAVFIREYCGRGFGGIFVQCTARRISRLI